MTDRHSGPCWKTLPTTLLQASPQKEVLEWRKFRIKQNYKILYALSQCSLFSLKVLPKSIFHAAFSFVLLNSNYTDKLLYLLLPVPHIPSMYIDKMLYIFHMLFYKLSFKHFTGIQIRCISISNSYKKDKLHCPSSVQFPLQLKNLWAQ